MSDDCGQSCNYWCKLHPGCGLEGHQMSIVRMAFYRVFGCPYGKYKKVNE
jgi:hypothetical protein